MATHRRPTNICFAPPLFNSCKDFATFQSARGLAHFKSWRRFLVLIFFATQPLVSIRAQTYSIDWFKISGGGGTSAGGEFSISGTIGQHDANTRPMSGGNFSLTGGFWSLLFVTQTPGAPALSILLTGANTVIVSWPSSSTGFSLQQNTDLSTANWVTPSENINDDGTNKFIIVNPPSGNRFYRLIKP
jgi:hypothetical protein